MEKWIARYAEPDGRTTEEMVREARRTDSIGLVIHNVNWRQDERAGIQAMFRIMGAGGSSVRLEDGEHVLWLSCGASTILAAIHMENSLLVARRMGGPPDSRLMTALVGVVPTSSVMAMFYTFRRDVPYLLRHRETSESLDFTAGTDDPLLWRELFAIVVACCGRPSLPAQEDGFHDSLAMARIGDGLVVLRPKRRRPDRRCVRVMPLFFKAPP